MNTTFKGTPGPWHIDGHDLRSVIAVDPISNDRHTFYKHVCSCDYGYAKPEDFIELNKANAKLIACAPEMLEMLVDIYENDGKVDAEGYKNIYQLIQKATQ